MMPIADATMRDFCRASYAYLEDEYKQISCSGDIIPIVMAANDNYVPYAGVAVQSLIDIAPKNDIYLVYIFHAGISNEHIEILENQCSSANVIIKCVDIAELLALKNVTFYSRGHITEETFYRFFIPEVLPFLEKILYLDCDLIVQNDLNDLYNTDVDNYCLAAVYNPTSANSLVQRRDVLKLDLSRYFNAGVLLINIKKWLEDDIAQQCLDKLNSIQPKDLLCLDQDILNIVCSGKVLLLDKKWNFMWHLEPACYASDANDKYNFNILHFSSGKKPWVYPQHPLSHYFWKHAIKSVFYEEILQRQYFKSIQAAESKFDKDVNNPKRKFAKMKILVTVAFMDGYHGSAMHVRDLAGFFKNRGDNVRVAAIFITHEWKKIYAAMGIPVSVLQDVPLEEEYDIVFIYHYPTAGLLLQQGLRCRKLVIGSLSWIGRMETFPLYWQAASLLTTMSARTAEAHSAKYSIPLNKIYVFENPIPDEFAKYKLSRTLPVDCPQKIAVVSNHVPAELKQLPKYLPDSVEVTYYGTGSDHYVEMKPPVLAEYDVVITIGKTIQYAMGLGICAYEYDWNGGCGYITPLNMDVEAKQNFSGNLTRRKISAEAMAAELLTAYAQCRSQLEVLKNMACARFLLSNSVYRLLQRIDKAPVFDKAKMASSVYDAALDMIHDDCFVFWTGVLQKRCYQYQKEVSDSKGKNKELHLELQKCQEEQAALFKRYQQQVKELKEEKQAKTKLQRELKNIKNGFSFRIGRIITAIPRMLLGKK